MADIYFEIYLLDKILCGSEFLVLDVLMDSLNVLKIREVLLKVESISF